ncbi:MAG TPA: TonB-dependent siderophore receptor [Tahibacter sp.]|uniref:TonB-dependent receptor n=1 Tax=Tahibacter sp. TaxID=2056211 RepID=UPI002C11EFBF|nr:TonB-dependent siderophore receptor [Tahibacter sp.]HSX61152.1 TonB-dependent siderophore receptor [Tahibacter sp.]
MSNSSYIRSAAATPPRLLSTALGLALASTAPHAFAETAVAADVAASADAVQTPDGADGRRGRDDTRLDAVDVQGTSVKEVSSPKYTAPLRDTPQNIEVVSQDVMKGQNLLSLRDVLSTLPGITFGAGEGGGGFGDSINLRGFSANNDIQVDGVRDSAQYSRTDTFNLEQIEVVNGANSVYSGAGSVGGTINLVSKVAGEAEFTNVGLGVGTDSYGRVTLDTNQSISDGVAFRINLMGHRNDVPGRDVEEMKRWGFAPSIAFGLGSDTVFTLSYLHQRDDNTPQYGVPYFFAGNRGFELPGLDPSTYYGYRNVDTQEIEVDAFTGILSHTFNDNLRLRNFTRVQEVNQFLIVDPPQGTFCLANNQTPIGGSCSVTSTPVVGQPPVTIVVPPNTYMPSGPRGNVRDTSNRMLVNQTDLTSEFNTGSIEHTLVTGFSLMHETFTLDGSSEFRNPDGSNPYVAPNHLPFTDPLNPDTYYTGPRNRTLTSKVDGELDNAAIYAFDTLKFSEQWQLNLGTRFERNEGSSTSYVVSTAAGAAGPIGTVTGANAPTKNNDDLFSYRAGLVFKPVEAGSIYVAYGNSKTPSKASVSGSCTVGSTTGTNNCTVDPETAVNYEIGTKWDLLDQRLSLTASIFRNDRENYRVADPGNPDNPSGQQQLDGEARVDGILLGVSGNLSEHWAVYANYTYLQSEVLQGVSNRQAASGLDYTRGDDLVSVPKHAFNAWTTLDVGQWQFGYGVNYQGTYYLNQHSATNLNGPLAKADDYWTHRAMAAWNVNRDLRLQLNVNNLFDKEYYTRIRTAASGWATPGEGRQVTLQANYSF